MTPKELFSSIDKRVVLNDRGKAAFSDSNGVFYLVGVTKEMLTIQGRRQAVYCGIISRTITNHHSRTVNAEYIELAEQ